MKQKQMKVSELIASLLVFQVKYGDLPVIGRGFDESGYDHITMHSRPIMTRKCNCRIHAEDGVAHHGMFDSDREGEVITACFVDANGGYDDSPELLLGSN